MIAMPSSLTTLPATHSQEVPVSYGTETLVDLMSDGFYMLLLIKRGNLPTDKDAFTSSVLSFLTITQRKASQHGIAPEDIDAAMYAFCAAVDEVILSSAAGPVRDQWQLRPLQLFLFGDQLAGDRFFAKLEQLRVFGAKRLMAMEVYHLCLLMGFQGKFRIEGDEKLAFLIARLGEEITYLKDKRTSFAPRWAPPDSASHPLRRYIPLWVPVLILGFIGLTSYWGLRFYLDRQTSDRLAGYHDLINMPSRTAHLKITLP